MASLFRLVSGILLSKPERGNIRLFEPRRNPIVSAASGKTRVVCGTSNW
jgi:hypothetical protein